MALFLLLTLYCADRIVASDDWVEWGDADGPAEADATRTEAPRGSRWWTLAAIACCAAGMASKQNMVIAPLLVALYDRAYRCRSWREWRRRAFSWNCRGPLYLGLLGCWLYLGLLLATSVNNPTAGMAAIRAGVMPWNYLLTQSQVIVHYLRLCVAPWPLLPTYDWPIVKDWTEAAVTGPAILALVLAGTLAWFLRPALGWAAVVFFFVLAPTSSVYPITTEVAAERRMYLPLAALLTLAAVGADRLLLRLTGGAAGTGAFLARAVPVASLAVAAAVATAVRTWDYRSELAIWTEAVRWYPDDFYINTHLGCALVNEGRYAEAAERLRKALGSRPEDGSSLVNLGISLERLGQDAEAERVLRHAVRVSPDEYRGHDSLGVVLERTGRPAEAADAFAEAVKLAPDNVRIRNRLAAISARLGRTDRAVEVLEETLKRSPDDRYALTCLAGLLAGPGPGPGADGRPRDAARAVELGEKAVAGEGETDPSAWSALATALAAGGKFPEAARAADRGRLAAESAQDAEKAARLSRSASLYRMGRADPDGFIPP
jgi:Flp pilus assembly protein TadD